MQTLTETPERWSLIGGGYKRLAQISAGKDQKACNIALEQMEAAYRKAWMLNKGSSYPMTNALTASFARGLRGRKPDQHKLAQLKTEVEDALSQALRESQGSRDDFWAKTADPDARLMEHLFKFLGGGGKHPARKFTIKFKRTW